MQMTEEELMNFAENKYKTLVSSGEWRAPNEDQKEVTYTEDHKLKTSIRRRIQSAMQRWVGRRRPQVILTKSKHTKTGIIIGVPNKKCAQFTSLKTASCLDH